MNLTELLQNPPLLHADSSGNLVSWQLDTGVLKYIDQRVDSSFHTLETGAGISTILFAIKHSYHTCVVPDSSQIQRIIKYCNTQMIAIDRLCFEIGESEKILPQLNHFGFDLALIDGRHAFPTPFIDWYYIVPRLKNGGVVIIDDTHLWTGRVMKQFLRSEPEWELKENFPRSVAFMKVRDGSHEKEWVNQPFLLKESTIGIRKEQLRYSWRMIREGQITNLLNQVKNSLVVNRKNFSK